jgi:acetolactate decarboxylase
MLLPWLLLLGCAANGDRSESREPRPWDGEVWVHGALRAMLHEGRTGAIVSLDSLLPNPDLYALGALADLAGEVTVVGGKAYLSYPDGADASRTETAARTTAAAALLVGAEVPAWNRVVTERRIRFEDLDVEIAELATSTGVGLQGRFPFLIEGDFEDLHWHVIDGRRLGAGAASHQDHEAAAVHVELARASGTLLGFYSESDQGVLTHMGSKTHIHCALDAPLSTGHVDGVTLPAGTRVAFPAGRNPRPDKASSR